jgi:hypothetical protein
MRGLAREAQIFSELAPIFSSLHYTTKMVRLYPTKAIVVQPKTTQSLIPRVALPEVQRFVGM